jgi:hypothetical protein
METLKEAGNEILAETKAQLAGMRQDNTEPKYYTIEARKWFEKVNGNTYHSVYIFENGKLIASCPYTYGYGTHYEQTALELLHSVGIAKEFNILWKFAESIGREKVLIICQDVPRKKDLKLQ